MKLILLMNSHMLIEISTKSTSILTSGPITRISFNILMDVVVVNQTSSSPKPFVALIPSANEWLLSGVNAFQD